MYVATWRVQCKHPYFVCGHLACAVQTPILCMWPLGVCSANTHTLYVATWRVQCKHPYFVCGHLACAVQIDILGHLMCPLQTPKLSIRPLDDICIADTHTFYLATCCVYCRYRNFLSGHLTTCVLQTLKLFIWPFEDVCIADTHTFYLATCCVHCRHPHLLSGHLLCALQTPTPFIWPLAVCIADTHTFYLATCCVHCRHPHFVSGHLTACVLQTPTPFIWPLAVCIADIWDLKRFSYPWPTAQDTVLFRDFSVEDLQTAMRGTPVRHAVFVQVLNNSPEEAGVYHCLFLFFVFCFMSVYSFCLES